MGQAGLNGLGEREGEGRRERHVRTSMMTPNVF